MSLDQDISDIVTKYRSIGRIVVSDRFISAFDRSSSREQEIAKSLALEGKRYELEAWVAKQNKNLDLWLLTTRELRSIASDLGIRNYSHFGKALLQSEILRYGQAADSPAHSPGGAGSIHPGPRESSDEDPAIHCNDGDSAIGIQRPDQESGETQFGADPNSLQATSGIE